MAQIATILFCAAWVVVGGMGSINPLTLVLSVVAITLTQMVLNQQKRHDAALHLKLDELIYSKQGARDELAHIEEATEEQLESLRRTGAAAGEELEDRGDSQSAA
ncbi:hypothetical protein BH09PSE4_BH09PSE4_18390 [soil metagenome]